MKSLIKKHPKLICYICALGATVFWGTHSNIIRFLVDDGVFPMNIAFIRVFMASLLLASVAFIFDRKKKEILKFPKYNIFFILGGLSLALNFVFFHKSLQYTFASYAILLESFSPVFVLMLSLFITPHRLTNVLKKNNLSILFIIIAFGSIGSSLLFLDNSQLLPGDATLKGNILALISTLFFALFFIASSELRKNLKNISSVKITSYFLFLSSIVLVFFINIPNLIEMIERHWFWLSILIIFPTALSYFLWNYASKKIEATPLAVLFNLGAVNTIIIESIFLNFHITYKLIIAALLIISSSVFAEKINKTS